MAHHKLTRRQCESFIKTRMQIGKTGLLNDGAGLYLRGTATGTASWIYRYESAGRTHEHGLGSYATYDLGEARERARRCRQQKNDGTDPIAARQAERHALLKAPQQTSATFKYCVEQYLNLHEKDWRSFKHRKDWQNSLVRYAYPVLGNMLVSAITEDAVLAALRPQWEERTETLMRVRNRIELVLNWAAANKYRSGENPARWRGGLDASLNKKARKATEHFAALRYQDIPALMTELAAIGSTPADALIYCILTGARTNEVRLARWSEIDLEAQLWTLPAERMKKGREHRVPLADAAMALLRRQPSRPTAGQSDDYVFTGHKVGRPIADRVMLDLLKKLRGAKVTVHGTARSALESWGSEMTPFSAEVRQLALAHTIGDKTKQAYHRTDLLPLRRQYAAAWATFCTTSHGTNVTPIRAA